MAAISLTTAGRVELIESHDQTTLTCGVNVTAGAPVFSDSSGNWALAKSDTATNCAGVHFATRAANKGEPLAGLRAGKLDGFNLSAMAYNDPVYLIDAGGAGTAAGTVSLLIGRVQPALANSFASGAARDKVLRVSCPL